MAYTPQAGQYDFTPNSGLPFEIATSFQADLLDGTTSEAGLGSLLNRSIANDILYYNATKYPFDQYSQLFGGLETTPTGLHEWYESDILFDYAVAAVDDVASTTVINNTDAGSTYVPAATGRLRISTANGAVFAPFETIRYETASGWAYAYITSKVAESSGISLYVESIDGTTVLPVALSQTTRIERVTSNMPQDKDYDPQPRQTDPEMYITYTQNYRKEVKMTDKFKTVVKNGGSLVDLVSHYQEQLIVNFRKEREADFLLGPGELQRKSVTVSGEADRVFFSNGIYYNVRGTNLHTSDLTTSSVFDPAKFQNAINNFVLYNFGGESDGPDEREFFVDPLMQSYFDQAYEDRQRFYTQEYVAGVSVNRFGNTLGAMDVVNVPSWAEQHPIVNGRLRGGSAPRAVGLLMPVDADHVDRVLMEGMGPRQEVFKRQGGDRIMFQRIESNEGLALKLKQHMAVFEQVSE